MADDHTPLAMVITNLEYFITTLNGDFTQDPGLWKKYTLQHLQEYTTELVKHVDKLHTIISDPKTVDIQHTAWIEYKDIDS